MPQALVSLATTPIHQVDDGGVICSARRTERHQKAPDDVNNVHARRADKRHCVITRERRTVNQYSARQTP